MSDKRVLFISQEIAPYLTGNPLADFGKQLAQNVHSHKFEVRTFMPKYGSVNERRNQLHEVIRLSGLNISIDDNDHPLIIKVASLQPSRIQVYFIDNDDYFQKLASDSDPFGSNRADNDERMIFYAHGTMTTAKKLRWEPDVMHVSGWMSSLVPLYLKRLFADGPSFHRTKVVYTVMPENELAPISDKLFDKLRVEGVKKNDLKPFLDMPLDNKLLHSMAIQWSDGVVFRGIEPDPDLVARCEANGTPWISIDADDPHAPELDEFYKSLMTKKK